MAIIRSAPESQPAVSFDHIHMTRLEIIQPCQSDNAAAPVYQVRIHYREYGVDAAGLRHYKAGDPVEIGLPDFLTAAMAKAATGDMDLINALTAIQVAVAQVITDQTGIATTVV